MAGIDDVTPGVQVEGLEEAIAKFNSLGEAGAEAFNKVSEAASKVEKASESINKVSSEGSSALKSLGSAGAEAFGKILDAAMSGNFAPIITKMFGEVAGSIAETTTKLVEFIDHQAQAIETLSNLATATGMSTSEILGMREAFASVGISTTGFERSIGRLAITIANEWSSIQQSVRTSADEQTGAMLHVQTTAFDVQKAYTAMGTALREAGQSAKQDAIGIEEAALGLKRAQQALAGSALEARSSALGVESAKLALIRAQMNLAKDSGQQVNPADEKALKIEQDKLAVKDAQLRIDESIKKQADQATETETKGLALKKAKLDLEAAENKASDDAVKNADRIHDAQLNIQKSQLAAREAQEKMHESDLKNVPAIAKEIDGVVSGYKKWEDVTNHTELSAQNLTKAVILAASAGSKEQPTTMAVFKEMSQLFEKMGDDASASNAKLEIIQHTMGAGFRSGQASAAQINALMARGYETVEKFNAEMSKFGQSINLKAAEEQLKDFNVSLSRMEGAWDVVKSKMAGVMSVPLSGFFDALRESITSPEGALNHLAENTATVVAKVFEAFGTLGKGLADIFAPVFANASPAFAALGTLIMRVISIIGDLLSAVGIVASAFTGIGGLGKAAWSAVALGIDIVNISIDALRGSIGAVMIGLGGLYAFYLRVTGQAKTLEEANKNMLTDTGKAILKSAAGDVKKDISHAANDIMGTDGAKDLDKAANDTKAAASDMKTAGAKHQDAADSLKAAGTAVKDTSAAAFDSASKSLQDAGGAMAGNISGAADRLNSAASALSAAAQAIVAAAKDLKPAGAKATGGKISGPGGPKDDHAGLYALSDGEFVMQSDAVSHYGSGLFEALNSLSVGGFATGGNVGAVSGSIPKAATGSGAQNILNLSIDGHQFNGLRAPDNVAASLKTYAVGRQSSTTGKKPSWVK